MPEFDLEGVCRASRSASDVEADDRIWAVLYELFVCCEREHPEYLDATMLAALRRLADFLAYMALRRVPTTGSPLMRGRLHLAWSAEDAVQHAAAVTRR